MKLTKEFSLFIKNHTNYILQQEDYYFSKHFDNEAPRNFICRELKRMRNEIRKRIQNKLDNVVLK